MKRHPLAGASFRSWLSRGAKLRALRLFQGITLEDVSEQAAVPWGHGRRRGHGGGSLLEPVQRLRRQQCALEADCVGAYRNQGDADGAACGRGQRVAQVGKSRFVVCPAGADAEPQRVTLRLHARAPEDRRGAFRDVGVGGGSEEDVIDGRRDIRQSSPSAAAVLVAGHICLFGEAEEALYAARISDAPVLPTGDEDV